MVNDGSGVSAYSAIVRKIPPETLRVMPTPEPKTMTTIAAMTVAFDTSIRTARPQWGMPGIDGSTCSIVDRHKALYRLIVYRSV